MTGVQTCALPIWQAENARGKTAETGAQVHIREQTAPCRGRIIPDSEQRGQSLLFSAAPARKTEKPQAVDQPLLFRARGRQQLCAERPQKYFILLRSNVMSIKYGDKSIKKVYMGDKEIKSAYMGDKLVVLYFFIT